jgi:hypothetical protein
MRLTPFFHADTDQNRIILRIIHYLIQNRTNLGPLFEKFSNDSKIHLNSIIFDVKSWE